MNIKKFILDVIFPIRCLSCGKYEKWICPDCAQQIKLVENQVCPVCKKIFTPNGKLCFSCRATNSLDGILVASFYREKKNKTLLAELIHYYKYRFIQEIGIDLGKILEKSILNSSLTLPDLILPVPLHQKRLRFRGFNQALIMANYLGKNLTPGLEIKVCENLIIRNRNTPPQMKIKNRHQRKTNVQNAFMIDKQVLQKNPLKDKIVFLIDDVATTGSTLFECAKILKKNKVKKVYGVVLARQ